MDSNEGPVEDGFKGMTNARCPYLPCHQGVKRDFNCLFCYCPLYAYDCGGFYKVFTDRNGQPRKDCTDCKLPHDGIENSWNFIRRSMDRLVLWDGRPRKSGDTPPESG